MWTSNATWLCWGLALLLGSAYVVGRWVLTWEEG